METLCACSQMKNSKQKNVLDWGKEANESKEERKDPFLCRKENKSSLPELSVLWFVVVTCPCICCLYFSCRGLFLCLRLLCPFKCLSSIRQRDRNRVVMRRPGNPDQLSLTLAGPVVPSVCGFMGALGRYSPGVAEVVDESFRVRDGILEKWLGELEKKTHGKGWWTEKESCKEEVKKNLAGWIALPGLQTEGQPWQPLHTAVLISWSRSSLHLGKRTFFRFNSVQGWYILCPATSSWTLLTKHTCRKRPLQITMA